MGKRILFSLSKFHYFFFLSFFKLSHFEPPSEQVAHPGKPRLYHRVNGGIRYTIQHYFKHSISLYTWFQIGGTQSIGLPCPILLCREVSQGSSKHGTTINDVSDASENFYPIKKEYNFNDIFLFVCRLVTRQVGRAVRSGQDITVWSVEAVRFASKQNQKPKKYQQALSYPTNSQAVQSVRNVCYFSPCASVLISFRIDRLLSYRTIHKNSSW